MNTNLMIPKNIKVGFQKRTDTYTNRLAYITYVDNKGEIKKEKSWKGWKDDTIPVEDYDNTPMEGFVLNKNVGGYKSSWNFRQSYIRVYDPRGFEFEIGLENLLYILNNCTCTPGKGLEGEFVYSWNGTELVLLPTKSPDYIEICKYNEKMQNLGTISYKTIKVGHTYLNKKNEEQIFLGKYDWYDENFNFEKRVKEFKKSVRYLFAKIPEKYDLQTGEISFHCTAISQSTIKNSLIDVVSEQSPDYLDLMLERVKESSHISPVDYENIELLDMDFNTFRQMVRNRKNILFHKDGKLMITKDFTSGKDSGFFRDFDKENVSIKCYYEEYSSQTIDSWSNREDMQVMNSSDLQDFYNKMQPKIGILHLKNGYFYRNFNTGSGNEFYIYSN